MNQGVIFKEFLEKKNIKFLDKNFGKVTTNSKDIINGDIFVAIRGGNNFIDEAIKLGSSFIVYDKDSVALEYKNSLKVEDSIKFLQEFSSYYRDEMNVKVIGITGSNGKTTTKDIIFHILNRQFKTKKTKGNLNNHIGVPLTLLTIDKSDEYLVLEMGMSGFGEIELLSKLSKPDYGIITNIGESHIKFLKTKENVFKAKSEIVNYIKKDLIINGDDYYLSRLDGIKVGMDLENNIIATDIKFNDKSTNFLLKTYSGTFNVKTNLLGKHNIINILFGIAIAERLQMDIDEVVKSLEDIEISKMRFEKIIKENNIYINDAYNASPSSVVCSLDTFSNLYKDKFKIVVLGDMLELGEKSKEMHIELKEEIEKTNKNLVFFYGKEMKNLFDKFDKKDEYYYFNSKEEIIEKISKIKEDKVILLKGSRGMKLEEIIK